jgi:hypothetical protein
LYRPPVGRKSGRAKDAPPERRDSEPDLSRGVRLVSMNYSRIQLSVFGHAMVEAILSARLKSGAI